MLFTLQKKSLVPQIGSFLPQNFVNVKSNDLIYILINFLIICKSNTAILPINGIDRHQKPLYDIYIIKPALSNGMDVIIVMEMGPPMVPAQYRHL